ncbi:MAG: IS5 family transposase [Chloroflexota bacterium]|nr:IS5 family transposase [Chloroflexota bacterium]
MRGEDRRAAAMWSYVRLEERVPADHPLRAIRAMTDRALAELDPLFRRLYSRRGRPSIPPEQLLRALVLQLLYSIRSERLLVERIDADLYFRWFVGLELDDPVWHPTTFTHARDGALGGEVAAAFFAAVVGQARAAGLLSDEHFSVDGTLLEAWAGQKSFRPIDERRDQGGPGATADFKGRPRRNDTHRSTTDPEARLYRKGDGQEAHLSYLGHLLTDNRCGLAVGGEVSIATGDAERTAALRLLGPPKRRGRRRRRRITLGCDKGYDARGFVAACRELGVTPHVCQNTTGRRSAIDERTTRHVGYAMSQAARRRGERVFGWLKTIALLRKLRHRGRDRVDGIFTFALAVYDLVRLRTLTAERSA